MAIKKLQTYLVFLIPLLLVSACASYPLPWSMPRPEALNKPPTATFPATVTPSVTPDLSCIVNWDTIPGPLYDSPLDIPAPVLPLDLPDEVRVLALLGTDRNTPYIGRTDAILLVFYQPRLARASLVSLPPDLYLYLPAYGMQRLQVAYAVGGMEQFALTLQYNFGICLDDYLLVHLDDFVSFINDLGGLYVDVLDGHPKACGGIPTGHIKMDGEDLLCYLSYRIDEGELERNLRQQEVARLLFQRVTEGGNLVLLPDWIDTYLPRVETSLTAQDLLEAIPLALRVADGSRVGFFRVAPGDLTTYTIPGELESSVFLPDRPGINEVLRDAVAFVQEVAPPSEMVLTLQYELTTSPTTTITPTPTITGTPTQTPTRTLTPVRLPTNTRTPTVTRTRTNTPSTTSVPPKKIAFSADANGDGLRDLLTMLPGGTGVQVLVQAGQEVLFSDWSPDGGQILFESNARLYITGANGAGTHLIPGQPAGANTQAAWSPDGEWIVFRNAGGSPDLYLIRPDGSDLRQLTDDAADDREPDWSPDGQAIAFITDRDGNPEIYLLDVTGQVEPTPTPVPSLPITRLTSTGGEESWPRFSPDGSLLVYARLDGSWDIYSGNPVDLSSPSLLRGEGNNDQMPSWSPDGSTILFVRDGEIYRMDADGSDLSMIANSLSQEYGPAWQP
jgi:LCP family protein required for cell wall assembly